MKQEEYLQTLTEQIQNKRAKKLVQEEIKNHIEEQTESYEADGMPHEEAVTEAVRQMGDPVDTGIALNKIHRPKMPWVMIVLALGLTIISIVMQAVIFKMDTDIVFEQYNLKSTILYNGISLAVMLAVLYVDYSFIAKYVYQMYTGYLIIMTVSLIAFPGWRYYYGGLYGYGLLMLYPLIFAGIIYRNRNRGAGGILESLMLSAIVLFWYWFVGKVLTGSSLSLAALAETTLIVFIVLVAAVWKGIFGKERKKYAAILAAGARVCGIAGVLCIFVGVRRTYIIARIENFFAINRAAAEYEKQYDYMTMRLRDAIAGASMYGNKNFVLGSVTTDNINTFLLNGIFTYFGKIAGIVVIALLLLFVIIILKTALRQSNRISFLVGTACSMGLLIRILAYIGMNLGYSFWWTTLIPFFSFGRISAVMNGIYVGLILSVYRNSNILKEERGGKRLKLTFEIKEE